MAFTKTDVGHGLFSPRLLLLLILQHHHQRRPWVRPTPLSLFPLLYHLVQVFSWFCVILSMFVPKSLLIFLNFELKNNNLGASKKILLQGGKGIPKSSQWKIEATFLISFGGGERGERKCLLFCNIFWRRIRRTRFPSKFCLFYEIRKLKEEKKEGKKQLLIRPLKMCLLFFKKYLAWESANFFWIFLQFLNLKIWFQHIKSIVYILKWLAQIRQKFYP